MLTAEQRSEYQELGLVRLPGAVESDLAGQVRDRIWALLDERFGIRSEDPASWKRVNAKAVKPLRKAGAFGVMAAAPVREAVDGLLGEGRWYEPRTWGQLLMTFPGEGGWGLPNNAWGVPSKVWHFDFPARAEYSGPPGVQLFLLLDRVVPGGGGTLFATGCHRVVARIRESAAEGWEGRSGELIKALRREVPWVRALTSKGDGDRVRRFMRETGSHEGVPLRVVELVGEPGDVYLMHPWMPHAPARNCAERPRMVLTERIGRKPR